MVKKAAAASIVRVNSITYKANRGLEWRVALFLAVNSG